jgi:cytosine permease
VFVLAAQVVSALGLAGARVAFVVGGLLSGALGALSAWAGARTRMNLAMLADHAFGTVGGRVVKSVIALSLIGWVGVILSVLGATAGAAIHDLYGLDVPSPWIAVAAAVAVTAIALRGVSGLEHVGMVIGPLLLVLLGYTLWHGCAAGAAPRAVAPTGALTLGAAVSAVVGAYVVGIVIQPDYGRFVRRPFGAGAASGLALGVAFPAILTLSALPTAACAKPDLIAVMVSIGIGLPALALLVLGAWTDASACLYSGSLSLTNEFRRFSLPWVTVSASLVGAVLACLHAERWFMPFLSLLSVTFPPVAAVNVLQVAVRFRHGVPDDARPPRVNAGGAAAWLAGSFAGWLGMQGRFSATGVAALDSMVVAALAWLIGAWLNRRAGTAAAADSGR